MEMNNDTEHWIGVRKAINEFSKRFTCEKDCLEHLVRARWEEIPNCFHCDKPNAYKIKDKPFLRCKYCGISVSILAGTIFEATKVPIIRWYLLIFLSTRLEGGMGARDIVNHIGVSKVTALRMMRLLEYAIQHAKIKPF